MIIKTNRLINIYLKKYKVNCVEVTKKFNLLKCSIVNLKSKIFKIFYKKNVIIPKIHLSNKLVFIYNNLYLKNLKKKKTTFIYNQNPINMLNFIKKRYINIYTGRGFYLKSKIIFKKILKKRN